jgi:hypothetical protein
MKKAFLLIIASCCFLAACKKKKQNTDPFVKIEGVRTWHMNYSRVSHKTGVTDTAYQLPDEAFNIDYRDDNETIVIPKTSFMNECIMSYDAKWSKENALVFRGSIDVYSITLWYDPTTDSIKIEDTWTNTGPNSSSGYYNINWYITGHTP